MWLRHFNLLYPLQMPRIPFLIDFLYYGSSERVVILIKHVKLVPFPRRDAPQHLPGRPQAPKRSEPPFILLRVHLPSWGLRTGY